MPLFLLPIQAFAYTTSNSLSSLSFYGILNSAEITEQRRIRMKDTWKRKQGWILAILLAAVFIFSGCTGKDNAGIPAGTEGEAKQQEAGQPDAQTDGNLTTKEETGMADQTEDMLLLVGRKRVVSVQPDSAADILYEAGEGYYVQSAVYGDGVVFVAVYQEQNSESTDSGELEHKLCAVEDGEETVLLNIEDTMSWALQMEYVDGSLIVEYVMEDYANFNDSSEAKVIDFTKNAEGWQQGERYQKLAECPGFAEGSVYANWERALQSLKTCGELITFDSEGNRLVSYDTDGNLLWESALLQEAYDVDEVNRDYTVYSYTDYREEDRYDLYDGSLILHDNRTGEEQTLFTWDEKSEEKRAIPIKLTEDKLYYYRSEEKQEEREVFDRKQVYSYDLKTGEETFLYEAGRLAGPPMNTITAGVSGFTIYQGKYYFAAMDEDSIGWAVLSEEEIGKRPEGGKSYPGTYLSVWDEERDFRQYGTVEGIKKTVASDSYDIDVYEYYQECFKLDPSYEQAERINERLKEVWEGDIQYAEDEAAQELSHLTGDGEPDEYSMSYYPLSYDNNLSRVEMPGSDYLTVDYSGYEYTGGAHGYPYRSHYLFDLTTGEEKTLADLYQGTEEEFKDIVAQYSVQNWKDNPDPYFGWDSEDAAYADFHDGASLDMLMRYGTDGIVIEYSPYEYGPYASGYIEVEIPYEALNINL